MNFARRVMAGALWSFVCNAYQRFVIDVATPLVVRTRHRLIVLLEADEKQPVFVDLLLLLLAVAIFVWICRALRENRIFQWLYQIASFGLFGYFALFSWQIVLFLAYLFADTYPEYLEAAQRTIFDYASLLLFGPAEDAA